LNLEGVKELDSLIVEGYEGWVRKAPDQWKADGFLERRSPILVTSRFGQNARIAIRGNEEEEAESWNLERDYSKISYLTFALATTIE
jgi:hypothetical protein